MKGAWAFLALLLLSHGHAGCHCRSHKALNGPIRVTEPAVRAIGQASATAAHPDDPCKRKRSRGCDGCPRPPLDGPEEEGEGLLIPVEGAGVDMQLASRGRSLLKASRRKGGARRVAKDEEEDYGDYEDYGEFEDTGTKHSGDQQQARARSKGRQGSKQVKGGGRGRGAHKAAAMNGKGDHVGVAAGRGGGSTGAALQGGAGAMEHAAAQGAGMEGDSGAATGAGAAQEAAVEGTGGGGDGVAAAGGATVQEAAVQAAAAGALGAAAEGGGGAEAGSEQATAQQGSGGGGGGQGGEGEASEADAEAELQRRWAAAAEAASQAMRADLEARERLDFAAGEEEDSLGGGGTPGRNGKMSLAEALRYLLWCLGSCGWILIVFGFLCLVYRVLHSPGCPPAKERRKGAALNDATWVLNPSHQLHHRGSGGGSPLAGGGRGAGQQMVVIGMRDS